MQIKYYQTAWNDLKNSQGWFKKIMLLALLNFVPVFGQIVTFGYLYGWARDIAWGVHNPLPERILGNEDGKLYRRGFFALVITFVFSLVPSAVDFLGGLVTGGGVMGIAGVFSNGGSSGAVPGAFALTMGMLLGALTFVLEFAVILFSWVGIMRMSIYDDLGAGFQIGAIWKMMRRDLTGLLKVLGMAILIGIIIFIVFTIIFSIVMVIMFAGAYSVAGSAANDSAVVASAFLTGAGLIALLVILVLFFFMTVGVLYVEVLTARALGYWTYQFNVPQWRGKNDPLPFEYQGQTTQYPPQY